jgi:hypothetical protein
MGQVLCLAMVLVAAALWVFLRRLSPPVPARR